MRQVSGAIGRVVGNMHLAPGLRYMTPRWQLAHAWCQIPCTWRLVLGAWGEGYGMCHTHTHDTRCHIAGHIYQVTGTWHLVPGPKFLVPRLPGNRYM